MRRKNSKTKLIALSDYTLTAEAQCSLLKKRVEIASPRASATNFVSPQKQVPCNQRLLLKFQTAAVTSWVDKNWLLLLCAINAPKES